MYRASPDSTILYPETGIPPPETTFPLLYTLMLRMWPGFCIKWRRSLITVNMADKLPRDTNPFR